MLTLKICALFGNRSHSESYLTQQAKKVDQSLLSLFFLKIHKSSWQTNLFENELKFWLPLQLNVFIADDWLKKPKHLC